MTEKAALRARLTNFIRDGGDNVSGSEILRELRRDRQRTVAADPITKVDMQSRIDRFINTFEDGEEVPESELTLFLMNEGLIVKRVPR